MNGEIEVLQPGLFSTIQDLGRNGFLQYGVPLSGTMDNYSAKMANLLLQNPAGAAVLEITQMGPKLKFSNISKIAITGADLSAKINSLPVRNNFIHEVKSGDILSFGKRKDGCRAYLSIEGGFKTEEILESRSWYEGITDDFRLKKGMILFYETLDTPLNETLSSIRVENNYLRNIEIEVFTGPEYVHLKKENIGNINRPFSIDNANNRMAVQLKELLPNGLKPIITGPVLPGTVQLTPSGKMNILMKDCQTTGGYPRILQLSETGINTLSQKIYGDKICFKFKEQKAG